MGAKVIYCHAEDEIHEDWVVDFKDWCEDRGQPAMIVVQQDHLVYFPHHVRDYKQYKGLPIEEIIEDMGELVKYIYRCSHSTARII
jgi:hypothetical protein